MDCKYTGSVDDVLLLKAYLAHIQVWIDSLRDKYGISKV